MYCDACGAPLTDSAPRHCLSCGAPRFEDAKPCAGALVVADGRLLLVRRGHEPWAGYWDVPGGFCEHAEHPSATAVREVAEETGLAIEVTGFLGMWLDRYVDSSGRAKRTLNIYYHAVPCVGAELPHELRSDEVSEVRWFASAELPARDQLAFADHVVPVLEAWHEAVRAGATRTPMWDA